MINNSRVFIPQNLIATLAGDQGVACLIYYIGNGTTITVEVTSTAMIFIETGATGSPSLPNDGTSAAGTLTFSVATVDTMGELKNVINASTNFRCVLASSIQTSVSANLLIMAATACTVAGINIFWDQGDNDALLLAFGPEGDVNLDLVFAASRVSKSTLLDYRDPMYRASTLKLIGRPFPFDTVSRLFRYVFSGGNAGANETPTLTIYDSSQTADTAIWTSATTNLTVVDSTSTFNPPAELTSTPGNRLVAVLTSPVGTFTASNLEIHGGYGEPGLLV